MISVSLPGVVASDSARGPGMGCPILGVWYWRDVLLERLTATMGSGLCRRVGVLFHFAAGAAS